MRMTGRGAGLCLAVMWATAAGAASFDSLTQEQQDETIEFVVGNAYHTLFHEAGHMLVSEFDLPILGREEDSVDNLATVMMLGFDELAFDNALVDTADGFWMTDEAAKSGSDAEETDDSAYYDEHGLDLQRSYQVVCLMVGHDAADFKEIADTYELPGERRDTCAEEYAQISKSWEKVLKPHLRGGSRKARIDIVYDMPARKHLRWAASVLQENSLLERVAAEMTERYDLKDGITFRATTCGVENAFWSEDDRTVTFCYELANYYRQINVDWYAAQ
jgi:hypothetical protein